MTYEIKMTYKSSSCTLTVWEDENTAALSDVYTEFRGRKHATNLLNRVVAVADGLQLTVILRICAYGDGPKMNEEQLREFYKEFGFVETAQRDTMKRYVVRDINL